MTRTATWPPPLDLLPEAGLHATGTSAPTPRPPVTRPDQPARPLTYSHGQGFMPPHGPVRPRLRPALPSGPRTAQPAMSCHVISACESIPKNQYQGFIVCLKYLKLPVDINHSSFGITSTHPPKFSMNHQAQIDSVIGPALEALRLVDGAALPGYFIMAPGRHVPPPPGFAPAVAAATVNLNMQLPATAPPGFPAAAAAAAFTAAAAAAAVHVMPAHAHAAAAATAPAAPPQGNSSSSIQCCYATSHPGA